VPGADGPVDRRHRSTRDFWPEFTLLGDKADSNLARRSLNGTDKEHGDQSRYHDHDQWLDSVGTFHRMKHAAEGIETQSKVQVFVV
jgi:hypothetical protein